MLYDRVKIEKALDVFKQGGMIIVTDDNSRENEGDLVVAAQFCTTEQMAFIIRHSSGIVCVPMTQDRAKDLDLPMMVSENSSAYHTAFTVSVDAKEGTSTGISAYERALTSRMLAATTSKGADFVRPGHIFPLTALEGGVLKRSGHTEAAVDLCIICGLQAVAVIGELMNDDGTVKKNEQLAEFASQYKLPNITIADLIAYRRDNEQIVKCISKQVKDNNICYLYDIGSSLYEVITSLKNKANEKLYIYIGELIATEFIGLEKKYSNLLCIFHKDDANRVVLEQHSHAIEREVFWIKYGSIVQILRDFSFKDFSIISTHNEEEKAIYAEIIANFLKKQNKAK